MRELNYVPKPDNLLDGRNRKKGAIGSNCREKKKRNQQKNRRCFRIMPAADESKFDEFGLKVYFIFFTFR